MADRIRHISSSFDGALYDLKNDILMMSSLIDRIFQNAMTALMKRDTDLCDQSLPMTKRWMCSRSKSMRREFVF